MISARKMSFFDFLHVLHCCSMMHPPMQIEERRKKNTRLASSHGKYGGNACSFHGVSKEPYTFCKTTREKTLTGSHREDAPPNEPQRM